MKHEGVLIVTNANIEYARTVTSVGGYLSVKADAQLPALTSVGGDLSVKADARLPALTSVGGSLYVMADAQLRAPMLRFYGERYLEIARSGYVLFAGDRGNYRAGCRGPFTRDEALAHWSRSDERAKVFTAAILAAKKEG